MGDTPFYSQEFNNFDADSLNLIANSGSFFLYWGLIPTGVVSSAVVNQVAVCSRKYETARRIGAYVMIDKKLVALMHANERLFLETYTD